MQRLLDVRAPRDRRASPESFTTLDLRARRQRLLDLRRRASRTWSRDVGRAVALRLLDVDADRFLAVVERERARLLGPSLIVGDLAEPDELAVALGDDEVARTPPAFSRRPARRIDALVERAVHAADRRREVLQPAAPARPARR